MLPSNLLNKHVHLTRTPSHHMHACTHTQLSCEYWLLHVNLFMHNSHKLLLSMCTKPMSDFCKLVLPSCQFSGRSLTEMWSQTTLNVVLQYQPVVGEKVNPQNKFNHMKNMKVRDCYVQIWCAPSYLILHLHVCNLHIVAKLTATFSVHKSVEGWSNYSLHTIFLKE